MLSLKEDKERRLKALNNRMEEIDKLRGTGYWDSHYDNLWHSLYKRYLELKEELKGLK